MITQIAFFYFILFFTISCSNYQRLDSKLPVKASFNSYQDINSPQASLQKKSLLKKNKPFKEEKYIITNNFQNYRGVDSDIYIFLTSVNTGKEYIIPPTKYTSLELEYITTDVKIKGKCVSVSAEDFPLLVSVCEDSSCTSVRTLNALLKTPAHYNMDGIGGLFVPQIYPVSPCSPEYVDLIRTRAEYIEIKKNR